MFKSFEGLEKFNQFAALRDNNFVVPRKKKREETVIFLVPFKPEIPEKEIAGNKAFLFHVSCLCRKLISKCSLLPPLVDVVRVPISSPFCLPSNGEHLPRVGFLPNSQPILSPGMTPTCLASPTRPLGAALSRPCHPGPSLLRLPGSWRPA